MTLRSSDPGIKLNLLGGFEVSIQGRPLAGISYNKMRALLAYLAMEREQDHRREVLSELFWSNSDPAIARGNLRRTLADLRRVLEVPTGQVLFSSSKETIRLIPCLHVDALEFVRKPSFEPHDPDADRHAQEKLLALYHGEFMTGFSLPDCPDFEDWLQIQRETLQRRALALLEQLANDHESSAAYARALPYALRYAELEPWDEGAHRRIMRLHALSGRASAALVQYEACCALLKKDLGVLPSQDTQQLAERIRRGEFAQSRRDTPTAPPSTPAPCLAERRQVTVLYCELGVTAVDDPDEAMELLRPVQTRCAEIIRQLAGHIVQTHGGGLLAYFGYPQAHEDSARRAVQTALAVTRVAIQGIEVRAGVHTGLLVTGGDPSLPDPVGKTSRLAIQLRDCISLGQVAISQETLHLVAGYFDCISLGIQPLSGAAQPREVFRVMRETGARSRLEAATPLTPLIGRQAEITQMMVAWEEARQGASRVILLQGEPGIGKSRLLHALKQRLATQPNAIRELRCFPEFSQSPFYPLLATLETIFDFSPDDTPEAKSIKLAQYVEASYQALAHEAIPLLTALLALPPVKNYPSVESSPEQQKEATITVLLAMLQALAARQPVLLIVEDLHWIDPSSLELLSRLVMQQPSMAMLVILTARSEFTPPWDPRLSLPLNVAPLSAGDMASLVGSINPHIPAATVRQIVERADGIPLFAEEIVKIAALEPLASIPATLHDLLAARVDHAGEAKHIAQLAATLGREFNLDLLCKLTSSSPDSLTSHLAALQKAGLILKVGTSNFLFKHALIQDAAYQSQPRPVRQASHSRIAQILQSDFPEVTQNQPELLARHLGNGGEVKASIDYWIKAGKRALQGSANREAIAHFKSGLQLLMTLPTSAERDVAEFSILNGLWSALQTAQGYGSEEVVRIVERLSALRQAMADNSALFLTEWKRLRSILAVGTSTGTAEIAIHLVSLAKDDPLRKLGAHYLCAVSFFWLGKFEFARIHAEKALSLHQPEQRQGMMELFGEDIYISLAGYLSMTLHFLGFPDRAQRLCGQMLDYARKTEHPNTLAMAFFYVSALNRWQNRLTDTFHFSAETMIVAEKHGMAYWALCGQMFQNWARLMQGELAALPELQSTIAHLMSAAGGRLTFLLVFLIEGHIRLNMHAEALPLIEKAEADPVDTGDGHYAAEVQRLKGLCLLAISSSNAKEAEACFNQALAISRQQGAKFLELRATMSLARLWQQQGRKGEARCMLEASLKGFTEGSATPDLQEAAELLTALAEHHASGIRASSTSKSTSSRA